MARQCFFTHPVANTAESDDQYKLLFCICFPVYSKTIVRCQQKDFQDSIIRNNLLEDN